MRVNERGDGMVIVWQCEWSQGKRAVIELRS